MVYISFNDYRDCIENEKINEKLRVEEEKAKYEIIERKNKTKNKNKKELIEYLNTKKNVIKLLNKFFEFGEKITENNFKNCNNIKNKIIEEFDDIVLYKIKHKNRYILINIEEKINYNISFKILKYAINIIKYWEKEENKKTIYPIVIPIVIYIGKEKWNVQKSSKLRYITYGKNMINLKYNIIGEKIKEVRQEKNMTQEQLANELQLSVAFLSRVERGNANINLKRLLQISEILDVSPGYILTGSNVNTKSYLKAEFAEIIEKCNVKQQKLICRISKLIYEYGQGPEIKKYR